MRSKKADVGSRGKNGRQDVRFAIRRSGAMRVRAVNYRRLGFPLQLNCEDCVTTREDADKAVKQLRKAGSTRGSKREVVVGFEVGTRRDGWR